MWWWWSSRKQAAEVMSVNKREGRNTRNVDGRRAGWVRRIYTYKRESRIAEQDDAEMGEMGTRKMSY